MPQLTTDWQYDMMYPMWRTVGGGCPLSFFSKSIRRKANTSKRESDAKMPGSMKKYNVNEAVWIATALMAAERYGNCTKEDMYFKQADIVHRAQTLTDGTVDPARVSWWLNADQEKHTHNYLRADSPTDPTARRLSMLDEFPEKTHPEGLDMHDELESSTGEFSMDDLFYFVREQYAPLFSEEDPVDYWGILQFLQEHHEHPYITPEKEGLAPSEIKNFVSLKRSAERTAAELHRMALAIKKLYQLEEWVPADWLNPSKTKVRRYFCTQLKAPDRAENPASICIFVELQNEKEAMLRVSLDIPDDGADEAAMARFHSHLEIPLNEKAHLVYVSGSNRWGCPEVLTDSRESIRGRLDIMRKVQICKRIPQTIEKTNAQFHQEILEGVRALLPYYNQVVGKDTSDVEQKEEMEAMEVSANEKKAAAPMFDKNIILYGPPGTGKTYHTAIYAVAICDGKPLNEVQEMDYGEVMSRYEALKKEKRIAFTTFHQSYGYEEFIEGIKPVVNSETNSLGYTIEPGVFKEFCDHAEIPKQRHNSFTGRVWNVRNRAGDRDVGFDYEEFLYSEGAVIVEDLTDAKRCCHFLSEMLPGDLVVLGRDFQISAIGVVTDSEPTKIDKPPFFWKRNTAWLKKGLQLPLAEVGMGGKCISNFAVTRSKIPFRELLNQLHQSPEEKPYVFIIDEINRGNISKIFGELITLIEDTKRQDMPEAASAILPYSGTPFSVPKNVYLLGTMNTADRSIALMDTALRRRFRFIEMMPDVQILRRIGADKVGDLDVAVLLETINKRIAFLYDREHTIGHAFFTKLADHPNLETLKDIFEKSIVPLLQEYFYEDYQKIQLVLGDNGKQDDTTKFILDIPVKARELFKGKPEDVIDLPEKQYRINPEAFSNMESYKQIL